MHHCGMAHAPAYVDVSLPKTWMYILYDDSLHLSSPLQWAAITVHSMTSTIRTSMPAALRRLYVSNSNIVSSPDPIYAGGVWGRDYSNRVCSKDRGRKNSTPSPHSLRGSRERGLVTGRL